MNTGKIHVKRILSVLIVTILVLSLFPAAAFAYGSNYAKDTKLKQTPPHTGYKRETVDVKVVWKDDGNAKKLRPATVKVALAKTPAPFKGHHVRSHEFGTQTVTAPSWACRFKNLDPKISGNYVVTQTLPNGKKLQNYTTSMSWAGKTCTITNTLKKQEPLKVTGLKAVQGDTLDKVKLTWNPVPGAASYKVHYNKQGDGSKGGWNTANVIKTSIEIWDNDTTQRYYTYTVDALDASGKTIATGSIRYIMLRPNL